jgi:hypothetical protein
VIQTIAILLSLAFAAYAFWPAAKASARWVYQRGAAVLASGGSGGSTAQGGNITGTVTAEQAQAAQLVLARYMAQPNAGPVRDLIANGITTLASKITAEAK